MKRPVRAYTLPKGASWVDRASLVAWKAWEMWIRSMLTAAAIMIAVHVTLSFVSGIVGPEEISRWRLLTTWSSESTIAPSFVRELGPGFSMYIGPPLAFPELVWWPLLAWGLAWQGGAAAAGVVLAWPVLRRSERPLLIGAGAGLIATVSHLAAARLFTLTPFGAGVGSASFGAGVGSAWNAAAVIALWLAPVLGACAGWWIGRRRRRIR